MLNALYDYMELVDRTGLADSEEFSETMVEADAAAKAFHDLAKRHDSGMITLVSGRIRIQPAPHDEIVLVVEGNHVLTVGREHALALALALAEVGEAGIMRLSLILALALAALVCVAILTQATPLCTEDMSCWDCHTMGNKICGPA